MIRYNFSNVLPKIMLGPCYLIVIVEDDGSLSAATADYQKSYGVTASKLDNVLFRSA